MVVLKTGNTDRGIGERDKPIKKSMYFLHEVCIIGALLTNNTELTLYTYCVLQCMCPTFQNC